MPFDKAAILSECGAYKSKETRVCERNENTFTYPCSCFNFIVNGSSRNKTKKFPGRLTAVDTEPRMVIVSSPDFGAI